jgi:hypothetical protein
MAVDEHIQSEVTDRSGTKYRTGRRITRLQEVSKSRGNIMGEEFSEGGAQVFVSLALAGTEFGVLCALHQESSQVKSR